MLEPRASTSERIPPTSSCSTAAPKRSVPSSSRSAFRSGGRPPTRFELAAVSLRGRGDRLDELAGLRLVRPQRDVGLGDDADEPAVLDDGQPPNLVAGHESERLFEVVVGLHADEVP